MNAFFYFALFGSFVCSAAESHLFAGQIDKIRMIVNGVEQVFYGDQPILMVRGDKFKIIEVRSSLPSASVDRVNVVGISHSKSPDNDLGIEFDLVKDLSEKKSFGDLASNLQLVAFNKNKVVGETHISLVDPKLEYITAWINQETRVLRAGEIVQLKSSDKIKVDKVVTNLGENSERVQVSIVPLNIQGSKDFAGFQLYEIQFLHQDKVFAKIPMQVESK